MKQSFFQMIDVQAFLALEARFAPVDAERVPTEQCCGRVLAQDVIAAEDLPLTNRSCMDGYAVAARDLFGASESNPAWLERIAKLAVDAEPTITLAPGTCAAIATGGSLPKGADAVAMVEHTEDMGGGTIEFRQAVAPGEHVMLAGEDAAKGIVALERGRRIRVQEAGLLAGVGATEIAVFRKPRVAVLSTGDELVDIAQTPRPGQVRDVNSLTVSLLAEQAGAKAERLGRVADDLDALILALRRGLEQADGVLVSGGSSVGTRDLTIQAIESLADSEVLAHGVAMSPGKPTILARVGGKPVLGLPGQVASAQVAMLVLVQPLIRHLTGDARAFDETNRPTRPARVARNLASKQGREDYVRVALEQAEGLCLAVPRTGKSGLLRTLVEAQGLVRIDSTCEGLNANALVDVWLV